MFLWEKQLWGDVRQRLYNCSAMPVKLKSFARCGAGIGNNFPHLGSMRGIVDG
jgi:hypothetical protein